VSFRLTQLASLDGLRGIAILAVMLNNARYLPGGFLGVDIFLDLLNSTRMAKLGLSGLPALGVRFIAAFAVASLCFYLIERPFLRIKHRFGGVGAAGIW